MSQCKQKNPVLVFQKAVYRFAMRCKIIARVLTQESIELKNRAIVHLWKGPRRANTGKEGDEAKRVVMMVKETEDSSVLVFLGTHPPPVVHPITLTHRGQQAPSSTDPPLIGPSHWE